jgi:hypothetical protein
MMNSKTTTAMT